MEHLPDELLIQIFQQLSVMDLVNLSKISNRFKHVINNVTKLKFFNLVFDKKGKTNSEKNKKYSELTVLTYNARSHQSALLLCGPSIEIITFRGTKSATYQEIAFILRMCPNARRIIFNNVSTWPEVIRQLPVMFEMLYIEVVDSAVCVLDLFLKCRVFALKMITSDIEYGTGIRGFLRTQPSLKSIYCRGNKTLDLFYAMGNSYSENYEELPFKLKFLMLSNVSWKSHYLDLLKSHSKTLTSLEFIDIIPVMHHYQLAEFVNECKILEELYLHNCYLRDIQPSATITKIELRHFVGPCAWLSAIKNLKILRIINQNNSPEHFATINDFQMNLALNDLEITASNIYNGLLLSNVTRLFLKDIKKLPDTFIISANKLKEIHVIACGKWTEQILREISWKVKGVERLSVTDGICCGDVILAVKRNCLKLIDFSIRNVRPV